MKTYQWICDTCGKIQEWPERTTNPRHCKKEMRKMYVPFGVIYKGEGFTGAQKTEREER